MCAQSPAGHNCRVCPRFQAAIAAREAARRGATASQVVRRPAVGNDNPAELPPVMPAQRPPCPAERLVSLT